jgi:hypothetical protein
MQCVDQVLVCCSQYQNSIHKFTPDSKDLAPFIKELEHCKGMPTELQVEQDAVIRKVDECLTRLQLEVEKALNLA